GGGVADRVNRTLCYTFCFKQKNCFKQNLSAHALLQRICGLLSPRSHQETDCRKVHRDRSPGRGNRTGKRGAGGRTIPRRPHQRRSTSDPRSLFRRDAQQRRQLSGDVPQGEKRTGAQVQGGAVRLSRDKVNVLARAVADALKQMDEVDFIEDPNTIRQETRKILEDLLNHEERIDQAARLKIESQKRTILEGSQEWDILYRKYYNEEVKKLGV